MKKILLLILLAFIIVSCGEDTNSTPSKIVQSQPKFQVGQVVYVLGDYPCYIKSYTYADSVYTYTVVSCSQEGTRETNNWAEVYLYDNKATGSVSVINRDTTYHEQIVDVRTNSLTDQQQWVDYSFKNTQMALAGFLQEAHGDMQIDQTYGARTLYVRLKMIDSLLRDDIKYTSANMKAGKFPSGK